MRLDNLIKLFVVLFQFFIGIKELLRWFTFVFFLSFGSILSVVLTCLTLATTAGLSLFRTLGDKTEYGRLLKDIDKSLDMGAGTPLVIFI